MDLPRRRREWILLVTLLATLFVTALDFSAITTALPSLTKDLHSQAVYAWVGSAYLITSAAVAPVWGRVCQVWGRKIALYITVAVFFAGSIICALSKSTAVLLVGRATQGCGAGGIIVCVNICISALWCERSRGFFLSTTGLVWALSAGIGPLLGGVLSQYLSWRWLFWINLPICFGAFLLLAFVLDAESSQSESRLGELDWAGCIAIIGAAVMVLLSLDLGGAASPWVSAKVLGPLLGGIVLFGLFILWEGNVAKQPIVPLHLVNSWSRAAPLLVCFTHGFVNVSSWYFLPIYFQAVLGASPTRSGALLLPIVVVQAIAGVIAGAFIHRFGRIREVIWTGTATMTLGFGLFMSLTPSSSFATIGVFEVIAGIGVGIIFQAPLLVYQSLVEEGDINVATALFGFVRSLSTSASVVLGEAVFQNGMKAQHRSIAETLRPGQADNFTATLAASNALQVHFLAPPARKVVEHAYAQSLQDMWILYTSVAGIGLLVGVFVMPKVLLQTQSTTGVVSQTQDNDQ